MQFPIQSSILFDLWSTETERMEYQLTVAQRVVDDMPSPDEVAFDRYNVLTLHWRREPHPSGVMLRVYPKDAMYVVHLAGQERKRLGQKRYAHKSAHHARKWLLARLKKKRA